MKAMTNTGASDTQQEHAGQEQSDHGESSSHGRTGEGAASALAHMRSQDQKHWNVNGDPQAPPSGSGHP
jgi:hypothetical protein